MRRSQFIALTTALTFTSLIIACRVPETKLAPAPQNAIIYDTKSSEAIADRFGASQEERDRLKRYRTALAEPVSIIAWDEKHSESQVFFATNRAPARSEVGDPTFGPEWGHEVTLGMSRVALPRSQRGKAADGPGLKARLTSFISGMGVEKAIDVDTTNPMDPSAYFTQLRDVVARAPEHDVLLFVHGFNVSFDDCVTRAAQLGIDIPFNGALIAYSWPSQGGVKNYAKDGEIVAESVTPFIQYLEALDAELPPETNIHIVVHSMGNRLVTSALSQLPNRFRQPPRFANVALCAPDVGVNDFAAIAPQVVSAARRTTLYVCDSDSALIISKGKNQQQRIGDAIPPFVVAGVETVDASAIETNLMGHSYYGSNRGVLSDLFTVLKEDRGAARRAWLSENASASGSWWKVTHQPTEIRFGWSFDHLAPATTAQADPTQSR